MKAAVILSGCGVYDGSEIHESVFTLLALAENNVEYQIFAPNKKQFHVINHLNGDVVNEERNVLQESARIARGNAKDLRELLVQDFDMLVIPGGFGAAKNLNQWAISGPAGEIDEQIKTVIQSFVKSNKVLIALCMGPTVIAKALEGTAFKPLLSIGSCNATSPYDIKAIQQGLISIGSTVEDKDCKEVAVDHQLKIVSAPCYMMEASIVEVRENIKLAVREGIKLI